MKQHRFYILLFIPLTAMMLKLKFDNAELQDSIQIKDHKIELLEDSLENTQENFQNQAQINLIFREEMSNKTIKRLRKDVRYMKLATKSLSLKR